MEKKKKVKESGNIRTAIGKKGAGWVQLRTGGEKNSVRG